MARDETEPQSVERLIEREAYVRLREQVLCELEEAAGAEIFGVEGRCSMLQRELQRLASVNPAGAHRLREKLNRLRWPSSDHEQALQARQRALQAREFAATDREQALGGLHQALAQVTVGIKTLEAELRVLQAQEELGEAFPDDSVEMSALPPPDPHPLPALDPFDGQDPAMDPVMDPAMDPMTMTTPHLPTADRILDTAPALRPLRETEPAAPAEGSGFERRTSADYTPAGFRRPGRRSGSGTLPRIYRKRR